MIQTTLDRQSDQDRRLRTKTQDQQLVRLAVDGAGISPWEANVLVDVVRHVYFSQSQDRPLTAGQMRYECVAADEGAGKTMDQCKMVSVVLTLLDGEDRKLSAQPQVLRQRRICRMTEEAREQGGLLSQEDLGRLLFCDERTVRRAIAQLRKQEIIVATRGQQKDIGPTVSHKGVAIRHWMDGQEPVAVAKRINHSLHSVERYLNHFSRVVFLLQKHFQPLQIAMTIGISVASVKTYTEVYNAYAGKSQYARRFEEIQLIGQEHYQALDEKKGAHLPPRRPTGNGRRS
jgi:hypothetical protein